MPLTCLEEAFWSLLRPLSLSGFAKTVFYGVEITFPECIGGIILDQPINDCQRFM
jgi:hypothetical protein